MQLAILNDSRESLLFDRGRSVLLDAAQDGGVEDVETGVDSVANEFDRLLDETVNSRGVVGLVNDDTVFGGLLDLGHDNGTLVAMGIVEVGKSLEGVLAGNVRVQNEEGGVVLGQDLFGELQRASSAQGLALDGEDDVDVVLLGELYKTGSISEPARLKRCQIYL